MNPSLRTAFRIAHAAIGLSGAGVCFFAVFGLDEAIDRTSAALFLVSGTLGLIYGAANLARLIIDHRAARRGPGRITDEQVRAIEDEIQRRAAERERQP